jgi:hypothetical protein
MTSLLIMLRYLDMFLDGSMRSCRSWKNKVIKNWLQGAKVDAPQRVSSTWKAVCPTSAAVLRLSHDPSHWWQQTSSWSSCTPCNVLENIYHRCLTWSMTGNFWILTGNLDELLYDLHALHNTQLIANFSHHPEHLLVNKLNQEEVFKND